MWEPQLVYVQKGQFGLRAGSGTSCRLVLRGIEGPRKLQKRKANRKFSHQRSHNKECSWLLPCFKGRQTGVEQQTDVMQLTPLLPLQKLQREMHSCIGVQLRCSCSLAASCWPWAGLPRTINPIQSDCGSRGGNQQHGEWQRVFSGGHSHAGFYSSVAS